MNIPTHPFVVCNIEGVRVQALVDTGSMKSFIKKDIQDVIDFDCRRVNKSTERCNSITGDSLKIIGKINVNVNFSGSRHTYSNDFLISSNIEFDCVLGWDFLVNNHVDLRRGMLGGLSSYVLKGPHGKTSVCAELFQMRLTYLVLSNRATLWISRPIAVLSMVGIHICCFSLSIRHPLRFV